ncbi:carbohydrate kinase [uncultured Roseibium sp.]|uniref:carbohydrate kinase family protein n=1 Tax=uncultured Roseibium sp. TaxID=1936171 RepID=UPI002596E7FE|nr:carbohydrate kinase [uncultured Roseibium sp.]
MILCCGEALIDMIPEKSASGQMAFVPYPGGAVFNTAIALGRLGVKTGMLTGLSTDLFGVQLEGALTASGVDAGPSIRSDLPTTLAFVQLNKGQATYTFYDENSAGRMLDPLDIPALDSAVEALFFGGISLAVEPCADVYTDLLVGQSDQKVVMIDPNIRPGFIRDDVRYRQRLDQMLRSADIVKVSDEDLDWILPGPRSLREKAQAILNLGASVVLVTQGTKGAVGFTASGLEVSAPGHSVKVADTVGAGDTFNAGVLAILQESGALQRDTIAKVSEDTLKKALALGTQAAAITVSRAGANPPRRDELSI